MERETEERAILVPVTVRVRDREIQIPVTVTVGLDDLVDIVVNHLNSGTDIRELLVEHCSIRAYGAEEEEEERSPEAPVEEPRAGRRNSQAPAFSEEEVAGVDLEAPAPPYSGRGKKSRKRLLWEAAMLRAGRESG